MAWRMGKNRPSRARNARNASGRMRGSLRIGELSFFLSSGLEFYVYLLPLLLLSTVVGVELRAFFLLDEGGLMIEFG